MGSSTVLFVGFIVVMAAVVVTGMVRNSQRLEALAAWARQAGWSYVGRDDTLAWSMTGDPFGRGDEIEGQDVVQGAWQGMPACSFTYVSIDITHDSEGRTQRHSSSHHVVLLELPTALPFIEVTPDGLGAKLIKAAGGTDLDFESDDFNRTYRVDATDPVTAHAVIHPRLMERLLQPDARAVAWRIDGRRIVAWRPGSAQPDRITPALTLLADVVRSIPRHVWLDHGFDPAATR
ncbi:hypothetical protein [Cellulomonas alba]|uniref:Secreted protein n=1 Tax=Cellulomonas alba TaxID=3053467 RepID=A0ABT7SEP1_9CELL|nr:hypothetical protein [Cellulomonas alba]MDM7854640.1 hypothetical protein [Cellulomonas alba]